MNDYLPLITVFLSGLFGILVAVVTFLLADRKDVRAQRQEAAHKSYEEAKSTYTDSLACIEKCLRDVFGTASFPLLEEELAISSARLQLIAPDNIIAQNNEVSELMNTWQSEHRQSQSTSIGETSKVVNDNYTRLMGACTALANLMRDHLSRLREIV